MTRSVFIPLIVALLACSGPAIGAGTGPPVALPGEVVAAAQAIVDAADHGTSLLPTEVVVLADVILADAAAGSTYSDSVLDYAQMVRASVRAEGKIPPEVLAAARAVVAYDGGDRASALVHTFAAFVAARAQSG